MNRGRGKQQTTRRGNQGDAGRKTHSESQSVASDHSSDQEYEHTPGPVTHISYDVNKFKEMFLVCLGNEEIRDELHKTMSSFIELTLDENTTKTLKYNLIKSYRKT